MGATNDELFAMIADRRRATADLLESLDANDASTPSLCARWTVHDVAGHMVMPFRLSIPKMLLKMVRYRGNFNRLTFDESRAIAASTPLDELARELRANADHRFTPPGLGPIAPLLDISTHALDIRVPLGKPTDQPAQQTNELFAFLGSPKAKKAGISAAAAAQQTTVRATDTGFTIGSGPDLVGPAWALLLALTGRGGWHEHLTGDGVAILRTLNPN